MGDYFFENTPPTFLDPVPVNQSTGVSRYPPSNVTVNDEEGDVMTVCFWYRTSNTPYVWVKLQQNDTVPANSTVRVLNSSYASGWNTQYWWKVTADDGYENSSVIYTFRTKPSNAPPVVGASTPANGSTGALLGFSWSIPITDPEGDLMNWTIHCSNGQTTSATGASNGTKTLPLSGLAYSTLYRIWVNVTDPTGSHGYTRRWFTFSTKSAGGAPPGVGTSENQKPIADLSAGAPYQGFINLPLLFNGLQSHDPDGVITQWSWMFGDTTNGTGETIWHSYASAGSYTVTLTVTDDDAATGTATTTCVIIQPNQPPTPPLLTGPETGTRETMYTFTAVVFDDDNDRMQYSIVWGDDPAAPDVSVFLPNGTIFTGTHQWTAAGRYTITVTATDSHHSSTATKIIWIDAVDLDPLGYLLDTDGDGSYEVFRNDSTAVSTTVGRRGPTYLVDTDGDGTWEYTFDAVAGLSPYQEPETSRFDVASLVGIVTISVICTLVVLIFVLRRKGYF